MSLLRVFGLVLLTEISMTLADTSFEMFCEKPPNFGTGKYDKKASTCTVEYNFYTYNDMEATDFCEAQHPYSLKEKNRKGQKTICVITNDLECKVSSEILIGEKCFSITSELSYAEAEEGCSSLGPLISLHKITSSYEQKWISAFFSDKEMLWVGNNNKELKSLALAKLQGKSLSTKQGRPVNKKSDKYAILTRKGSLARLKGGVIAPVTADTKLPVICSQPAVPRQEYFASLIEQMRTFGYKVTEAIDRSGRKRAFTVIRGLHLFTINSRFDAGTKKLHEACAAFPNGYAATPYDFKDIKDFKRVLKEAEVNIVAVPGRKKPEFGKENLKDCTKDPYYKQARTHFVFDVMTATNKTIQKTARNDEFWANGFPTRTCGDMPRVALAYTQNGLVDVPNMARLFVACTFGAPPEVKPDDGSEACSDLADYNKKTKKCTCRKGYYDMANQKLFAKRKGDTSVPGVHCFTCKKAKEIAVYVLLDSSDKFGSKLLICLRYPFAYHHAYLMASYLKKGGKLGSAFGDSDDFRLVEAEGGWKLKEPSSSDSGKKTITEAVTEAYTKLAKHRSYRKLLILLLDQVPSDVSAASKKLTELRESNLEKHIEIFVAVASGDTKSLTDMTTTGKVHKIPSDHAGQCGLGTKVSSEMLRLLCLH
ncbi:hypothetical protein V3C99_007533 [Haemonchus contortus]